MKPLEAGDPRSVGGYELLGRLGSGGMGVVFLGRAVTGHIAALKVARAELADDQGFRRRFAREVDAARRVDARFTAAVLDADPHAPRPWLATEYIAGVPITQAVADRGPLPEDALRALLAGTARALEAIHAVGLTHRDLKPSNVLLADDGPRVIDFGIVRSTEHTQITRTGELSGSPGYMAPEQLRGDAVGPHTDVYALGATLVYAATGRGPYGEGDVFAMVYRTVEQDPDLSGVPAALRPTLARCLAKDPAERPTVARLRAEFAVPDTVHERRWLPSDISATLALAPPARPAPPGAARPAAPAPAATPPAPGFGPAAYGTLPPPPIPPAPAPIPAQPTGVPAARRTASRRALLVAVAGGGATVAVGGAVALWRGLGGDADDGAKDHRPSREPSGDGAGAGDRASEHPTPSEPAGHDEVSSGPSADPPHGSGDGRLPEIIAGTAFGEKPTMAAPTGDPPSGLVVEMLIEGSGRAADKGSSISVHFVMQVWGQSRIVDSSHGRGRPDTFFIGAGQVIKGWDEALVGKRAGSRVQLAVPPEKAYGAKGLPSEGIKGTDTLLFVVDLMSVPATGGDR
ncbi:protein kinase [Streptomyces sp. 71268]|uniref:protein kinase domain-containing protein n=1 Tax=Streptomyces sp. 71268 TaxID=3002640 RepID=UPI0023F8E5BB|nr:protein kinase [Streptomyces sp. 71268]WEV27866.1 protein kinase [Streptomyces sp. 71268]